MKIHILIALLLVCSILGTTQEWEHIETFNNIAELPDTLEDKDGQYTLNFTGNSGYSFSGQSKFRSKSGYINGLSLTFASGSYLNILLPDGVKNLAFDYKNGWNNSSAQAGVKIGSTIYGTCESIPADSIGTFSLDINAKGDVVVQLYHAAGESVVNIDNVRWNSLPDTSSTNSATLSLDVSKKKWEISKYLTGSHFVYGSEHDKLYEDERISDWMKEAKVKTIRWPGGTAVMYYHWDALTGDNFGTDRWDPKYDGTQFPESEYMDVDEYIAFCKKIGADPMIGINIHSGKVYKRQEDAKDEARRLIQHCVDNNYNVKHWYIGNEGYAKGYGASSYAWYIDEYAKILKAVDPDITIFGDWKFGPESKNRFKNILTICNNSEHLDVMEIHEKWGNEWGLISGQTVNDWKSEFPLYNGRFDEFIDSFHVEVNQKMGKNIKLGMNEWGLGNMDGASDEEMALLVADYLIEVFRNDIYSACYWNLNMGSGKTKILQTTDKGNTLVKIRPMGNIFKMFALAMEKNLVELSSSNQKVYGFSTISKKGELQLFVLNKSSKRTIAELDISNYTESTDTILNQYFDDQGNYKTETINKVGEKLQLTLNPYSFNRIVFNEEKEEIGLNIDRSLHNKLSIFPNPTNKLIYVKGDLEQFDTLTITDLIGKTFDMKQLKNESMVSLNVEGLSRGVYFIRLSGQNLSTAKKFIVQ